MKTFLKVFIISFICFFITIFLGSYSYLKEKDIDIDIPNNLGDIVYENELINRGLTKKDTVEEVKVKEPEFYTSLEEAVEKSNRVNFIFLGMEDVRTDAILFVSFCPDTKKVDLVSIPRDTYIHRKGYNRGEQRKINSVYGDHGVSGVKKTVSYILEKVPIHHYVMLDYEGVEKIIDSVGGVEVVVPFPMKYSDPTAKPPLYINIAEGKQTLDGKKSLQFLRYRKGNNNKGGYIDGDLGRINAQQQFLKSFVDKSLSYKLPVVIKKGFEYVKTDINLFEGLAYGKNAIGIKNEDFRFTTLPGKPEFRKIDKKVLSFYIHNPKETKKILEGIYNVNPSH